MKKELDRTDLTSISNLKLAAGVEVDNETVAYFLRNGSAGIINSRKIISHFRTLPLDNGFNRILKRSADIICSLTVILTIFPWLFPVIAVIIKLNSRGPVFFLQKRNKRNGELFTCIKFRSMYKNADADILPACRNDKRITSVGRFLRTHYIDELPQFLNVLWGDMSLIGPRPHMVSDNLKFDALIKNYDNRHKVKPGITGLAQIMGYLGPADNVQEMEARVNLDIYYSRHWSVKLDLVILYKTILKPICL